MPKKYNFTDPIQNAGGGGAFVELPFDVNTEMLKHNKKEK